MSTELREYLVIANVTACRGVQAFLVKATSESDAIDRWRDGDGEFVSGDIEVTDLGSATAELNE